MTNNAHDGSADSLTFIGTATTVLRLGGFTLLTDPNFLHRGQRAYLGYGLTSKRLRDPNGRARRADGAGDCPRAVGTGSTRAR